MPFFVKQIANGLYDAGENVQRDFRELNNFVTNRENFIERTERKFQQFMSEYLLDLQLEVQLVKMDGLDFFLLGLPLIALVSIFQNYLIVYETIGNNFYWGTTQLFFVNHTCVRKNNKTIISYSQTKELILPESLMVCLYLTGLTKQPPIVDNQQLKEFLASIA